MVSLSKRHNLIIRTLNFNRTIYHLLTKEDNVLSFSKRERYKISIYMLECEKK